MPLARSLLLLTGPRMVPSSWVLPCHGPLSLVGASLSNPIARSASPTPTTKGDAGDPQDPTTPTCFSRAQSLSRLQRGRGGSPGGPVPFIWSDFRGRDRKRPGEEGRPLLCTGRGGIHTPLVQARFLEVSLEIPHWPPRAGTVPAATRLSLPHPSAIAPWLLLTGQGAA